MSRSLPGSCCAGPHTSPIHCNHQLVVRLAKIALIVAAVGCSQTEPIITYTVPTEVPQPFRPGQDRMLAVMVPHQDEVWFFKVTGPEVAIDRIEAPFRDFVRQLTFVDGSPNLKQLPEGWRRAGEKPFRFASINIDTPGKQLDLSVSKLAIQEDWDQFVKLNVNRWRGQLGLEPADDPWAGGEEMAVPAATSPGIWVDLVGQATAGSMAPPPVGGDGAMPPNHPPVATSSTGAGQASPGQAGAGQAGAGQASPGQASAASPLTYDRPAGWRDGKMSSMRMAAFEVGPQDAAAEITVIPAGGDIKGNVKRWLGQIRKVEVTDQEVDQALQAAVEVTVAGKPGQRFVLTGDDQSIDATIVPIDDRMSLFIKMTGPTHTVSDQAEAIGTFLQSLDLNQ